MTVLIKTLIITYTCGTWTLKSSLSTFVSERDTPAWASHWFVFKKMPEKKKDFSNRLTVLSVCQSSTLKPTNLQSHPINQTSPVSGQSAAVRVGTVYWFRLMNEVMHDLKSTSNWLCSRFDSMQTKTSLLFCFLRTADTANLPSSSRHIDRSVHEDVQRDALLLIQWLVFNRLWEF